MIDQTKVTSGFDVEFLMGEEYIRDFLLCSLGYLSPAEIKPPSGH
jgi:hypothetical protein